MGEGKKDRELGMHRAITRRDFLNGVALGASGVLAADPGLLALMAEEYAPEKAPGYYPPALTGMRGNHDGTFTYAHALRDGKHWDVLGPASATRETYDLVVVGGGISGLAAAYFYRKAVGSDVRILILDNHDDFGGHAKRNEFTAGKRMLLSKAARSRLRARGNTAASRRDCSWNWGSRRDDFTRRTTRNCTTDWGRRRFLIKRRLARTG